FVYTQRQRAEGAGDGSAAGAHRPAGEIQGLGHSRPGRVPGDVEVTNGSARPELVEGRARGSTSSLRAMREDEMNRGMMMLLLGLIALPIALLAQPFDFAQGGRADSPAALP